MKILTLLILTCVGTGFHPAMEVNTANNSGDICYLCGVVEYID